jgi:hypothetical protein
MLFMWRIRYLDSRDKEFQDRDLWLDTETLEPGMKAAIEAYAEMKSGDRGREVLRYRHLFQEKRLSADEQQRVLDRGGGIEKFALPHYFEDENGKELNGKEFAFALTGDANATLFPAGVKPYEIEFALASKPAIDLSQVQISRTDLDVLAYFSRDFRELAASGFLVEGPGTLTGANLPNPVVQTAVSDDEIRSFVTIFRRLYMKSEPGNFANAAAAFARAVVSHPVGNWALGAAADYEQALHSVPDLVPLGRLGSITFTRKRLIDVFLYTQYAHQGEEKRERQYSECLSQLNGQRAVLFWLFLVTIYECASRICQVGVQVASFTTQYCKVHSLAPSAVEPGSQCAAIGVLERRKDREARILREKAEELAMAIWKGSGRPEGGSVQFLHQARQQLRAAMGNDEG